MCKLFSAFKFYEIILSLKYNFKDQFGTKS